MTNGYSSYFGFFVAGVLVGGAVAMFTTPYEGRKLRRIMRRKIEDGVEQVSDAAAGLNTTCHELYTSSGKILHDASKKVAALV